ncbi:KIF-binding protein [Octopus bimaculoides]|uniref:KIF-binding protein n=1 Tax=Octopus bimaculoides TaxID=37653 RepID=A0A0L8HE43_OCTBM|nr:KIF-binding protein [Octopus bimaculoides]|eukprot:XP_014773181.1 PREDICTED: KIF1-binding protein homolog [Octopus bimaculoides]
MADSRSYMIEKGYEEYKKAKHLSEEESKKDPENEPFKSKYKARDILLSLRDKMNAFLTDTNDLLTKILIAGLNLQLGVNHLETEELGVGEEYLTKVLKDIEDHKLNKSSCNIYQEALNNLGILWSHRGEFGLDEAVKYLELAENLYNDFKHEVGGAPHSVEELFRPEGEDNDLIEHDRDVHFENTYTHTMFYLAQVYAGKGNRELSAKYCHQTLLRQLESNQYNPLEWAINAASLSQYYLSVDDYMMARHCLASSCYILQEADDSTIESTNDSIARRKADISRCWAKYGLSLLESSKEFSIINLIGHLDRTDLVNEKKNSSEADHNADKEPIAETETPENSDKNTARFKLELTDLEENMPAKFVKDFPSAREVFIAVQKWLNDAKEYYVIDSYCNDYVEIMRDHSKAYKLLACFETDQNRQCKMQKRRIDLLSKLLEALNAQHYLHVCRQLMYELAETYSSLLDIKVNIFQNEESSRTPHAIKKINLLVSQSIDHYMKYIHSIKGGRAQLPDKLDESDVRPTLIAYFCVGNLYTKFICSDAEMKIKNIERRLACFKCIVDYCRKDPKGSEFIANELHICEEMVELLPRKIEQLKMDPSADITC